MNKDLYIELLEWRVIELQTEAKNNAEYLAKKSREWFEQKNELESLKFHNERLRNCVKLVKKDAYEAGKLLYALKEECKKLSAELEILRQEKTESNKAAKNDESDKVFFNESSPVGQYYEQA
jgi:chromosome segregation ATPase